MQLSSVCKPTCENLFELKPHLLTKNTLYNTIKQKTSVFRKQKSNGFATQIKGPIKIKQIKLKTMSYLFSMIKIQKKSTIFFPIYHEITQIIFKYIKLPLIFNY